MLFNSYLGKSGKLYQWSFCRTNVSATSAFEAVHDAEFGGQMPLLSLYVQCDFLGGQAHRTGLHAPAAMNAGTKFAKVRFSAVKKQHPGCGLCYGDIKSGNGETHHRTA